MHITPALAWKINGFYEGVEGNITFKDLGEHFGVSTNSARRAALGIWRERAPKYTPNRERQIDIKKRQTLACSLARKIKRVGGVDYPMFPSSPSIAKEMTRRGIQISPTTVRRLLKNGGMVSKVRRRVPTREEGTRKARLAFCKTIRKKDDKLMLFSDEHNQNNNDHTARRMFVDAKIGCAISRQMKAPWNTARVHVWGAIGYNFKSKLVIFDENEPRVRGQPKAAYRINSERYQHLCLDPLVAQLKREGRLKESIFMQDGARIHTAKKTTEHLEDLGLRFLRNWPPHSPDLNPIEHVWKHMNEYAAYQHPQNRDELVQAMQDFWDNVLTMDVINKYALDFHPRTQRCIKAEGQC